MSYVHIEYNLILYTRGILFNVKLKYIMNVSQDSCDGIGYYYIIIKKLIIMNSD